MAKENIDFTDDAFSYPLCWGITKAEMVKYLEKHHPTVEFFHGHCGASLGKEYIELGNIAIYNFIGDCGAVYLRGANYANKKDLKAVVDLMSECGFSKIFATIVNDEEYTEKPKKVFLNEGFTIVNEDFSNRNDTKQDIVLFKRINCNYKGY